MSLVAVARAAVAPAEKTFTFDDAIDDLTDTLERYQECEDPLSRQLFRWGTEVLQLVVQPAPKPEKELEAAVLQRIDLLATKILINPMNGRPLRAPVIERSWTWDESTHRECRVLFEGKSPLDGEEMSAAPFPHLFAREIIQLVGNFLALAKKGPARQLVPFAEDPDLAPVPRFVYERMATMAVLLRQQRQVREGMGLALVHMDEQIAEMQKRDLQIMGDVVAQARQHEAELNQRLAVIEQAHRDDEEKLNRQIADLEAAHRARVAGLEKRIGDMDQTNHAVAGALKKEVALMDAQHQKTASRLGEQITSLNTAHAQAETSLRQELTTANATYQQAMAAARQQHDQVVFRLHTQATASSQEVQHLKAALQHQTALNAKNAANVAELRGKLTKASRTINNLHHQVNNTDGSCSVS